MFRYLLNMSYLGTPFRGVQRQILGKNEDGVRIDDPATIQGQIEMGLKIFKPTNDPAAIISSRRFVGQTIMSEQKLQLNHLAKTQTDAGVHALHTTMHVDLQRGGSEPYPTIAITAVLNQYFTRNCIPIRILKTYLVPKTFHCRFNAVSRTYLYRLGVVQADALNKSMMSLHLPITELQRSLFISTNTFDINKVREAVDLFVGYHDFRTFMHRSSEAPSKITRKTIEKFDIRQAEPLWPDFSFPSCVSRSPSDYRIYDIVVKGNGFLYKQVRRTVATLIAVAKGIVTPRDIKFMLEIPSHRSWDPRIKTAPPHGLYLCEVAYSQQDRETFKEHLEN